MTDITAWAVDLFTEVGGQDWRSDLALGGFTVIALLVIVSTVLLWAVIRGGSHG